MKWAVFVLVAAAGLCPWSVWGEPLPVTLTASVDRSMIAVGEPVRYRVTASYPRGTRVSWPAMDAMLGAFQLEDSGSDHPTAAQGQISETRWYRLTTYSVGPQSIPAPTLIYEGADGHGHEVHGEPVTITVQSLLPQDWRSQDIRDVKPLLLVIPSLWRWLLGLALLLGGIVGAWWWAQRRHAAPAPLTPPRPAHEVALEELERLHRADLLSQQRYEAYYVRLSGIVRAYIEGRFDVRAPEMTTEEFLQAAIRALAADQQALLRQFLLQCDLVKFARYQPSAQEAQEAFTAAKRFVEETMPINFAAQNLSTAGQSKI